MVKADFFVDTEGEFSEADNTYYTESVAIVRKTYKHGLKSEGYADSDLKIIVFELEE